MIDTANLKGLVTAVCQGYSIFNITMSTIDRNMAAGMTSPLNLR